MPIAFCGTGKREPLPALISRRNNPAGCRRTASRLSRIFLLGGRYNFSKRISNVAISKASSNCPYQLVAMMGGYRNPNSSKAPVFLPGCHSLL
jgi:hypothetical protein